MESRPRKKWRATRTPPNSFIKCVQKDMPWPFTDVYRYDDEGWDTAKALAEDAWPTVAVAFEGLMREAPAMTADEKKTLVCPHCKIPLWFSPTWCWSCGGKAT